MNVVLFGPYPPPNGGVEAHVVVLRDFLRNKQIQCSVVSLGGTRRESSDGVYYPHSSIDVLRLLVRLRPSIIHLHFGGHFWPRLFALCLVCASFPRCRTVLTLHSGGYPSSPEGRSARSASIRGFILRRLDGLIAVNSQIADLFMQFGVPDKRIRVIAPHSVSLHDLPLDLPPPMAEFLAGHRPVFVTAGGLEREYDLELQIDTLDLIRRRHPGAGLVIIGSGSLERQLREQIQSKAYADDILLCGNVPHPVSLGLIQKANVFLRTTLYDGDSVSVRESIALGVPVVATDNGMRPEGVRLIPPSNPEALVVAIEKVLSEPERTRAEAPPSDEKNLEAVLEFYEELIGRGN